MKKRNLLFLYKKLEIDQILCGETYIAPNIVKKITKVTIYIIKVKIILSIHYHLKIAKK